MAAKTYEFAIKRDVLNSGAEVFTPVLRVKRRWFPNLWQRITCIYGRYVTLELDFEPNLTREECEAHIEAYQAQLANSIAGNVRMEEFHNLQEKEY